MAATPDPDSIDSLPQQQHSVILRHPQSHDLNSPAGSSKGLQVSSQIGSSTSSGYQIAAQSHYFRSRRVKKAKWVTTFPILGFILGLGITGILIWDGVRTVAVHKYCEVLNENFTSWNTDIWTKEVEMDGYGNGQSDMTTDTDENIYIRDGPFVINPTLQDQSLIDQNYTLDLRSHGCTSQSWTNYVTTINATNGTIINPVKSGHINTKRGASRRQTPCRRLALARNLDAPR
ncbi:hypothetical protein IAQ61_008903 [Plenodomus lingam]|uniref:GH16 domain-containing protein n=1 Tax=Leptosphaeria maculans (strain JN3 / isolate v23.1.3 / race Av1-4-5-6-7-8) TaxID=985895 RepID=E4ZPF4_LEPMJ|nr:hypothetical protein LEMA_P040800.1 [Plenodomus lingam JN3]KAH9864957.1 hypothetical protein IAQ61_008903 [Plenodomus lingam]CBX93179.1 hypothetical protein LEMA_P040800.1 [Plenodomus lingam JN3]